MKSYGVLCIAVAIIMLLAPVASLINVEKTQGASKNSEITSDVSVVFDEVSPPDDGSISVFLSESEESVQLEMRDYVIGVVAAEMPASYDSEALKAQALVAVTYAEYIKLHGENVNGADVTNDSTQHQGYLTKEQMQEKWGDAYDEFYTKIEAAVDAVSGKKITYKDEVIMPAYHAISCGQTQSAKSVWGKEIPYLQSVDSEWDKDSGRFESTVTVSVNELKEIMKNYNNADFDADEESLIQIKKSAKDGTVEKIEVCSVGMTGGEARKLFSLRSSAFDAEYSDGEFVFTSYGYGHGVGMSQNGANQMAKDGCDYKEIINHYYTGVEIV